MALIFYSITEGHAAGRIDARLDDIKTVTFSSSDNIAQAQAYTFKTDPDSNVIARPLPGTFTYDDQSQPQGAITSLEIQSKNDVQLATISGFSISPEALIDFVSLVDVRNFVFKGDNFITGNAKSNSVYALGGNDQIFAKNGNDAVYGGSGNDTVDGSGGNDTLRGESGDDRLTGSSGNDTLAGSYGADVLIGGSGLDRLGGGTGRDIFRYQASVSQVTQESGLSSASRDVILDFVRGQDKIDIGSIIGPSFKWKGAANLTGFGQAHYRYSGNATVVEISIDADASAEMSILLAGRFELKSSDFIL